MYNFRVIPILTIKDDYLIKTINFEEKIYVGDPTNTIKIFNEKFVDEICIIDIDATKYRKIDFKLIDQISSECFIPMSYGGGISNIDEVLDATVASRRVPHLHSASSTPSISAAVGVKKKKGKK